MVRTLICLLALVLLSTVALALGAAEAPVVDTALDERPATQEPATEATVDQTAEPVEVSAEPGAALSTPADPSSLFPGVCKYTCESCWSSSDCPPYFGRPQACISYCV